MTVTRDSILSAPRIVGCYLEVGVGTYYTIVAAERDEDGRLFGYALSERTGLLVRFTQTGHKMLRGSMYAALWQEAQDTGDGLGTLAFAPSTGESGKFPAVLCEIVDDRGRADSRPSSSARGIGTSE